MNTTEQRNDVFTILTDRIIEQLEKQIVPWRKPWTEAGHPQNLLTRLPYRGINTWLLASLGYEQNYFLTWKQVKAIGGSVKKGEKGNIVVFWKKLAAEQETDSENKRAPKSLLRYYLVFNVAQCEHLPLSLHIRFTENIHKPITLCDEIVARMPQCPTIKHNKDAAWYNAKTDTVSLPKQGAFTSAEAYYSTLFHELIHSTGHQSRLNRKEIIDYASYGSEPYGIEELTAEIGACYLNSVSGIVNAEFDSSIAYIKAWIGELRDDKRLIVYASSRAQKAVDFILNIQATDQAGEMVEQTLEEQA